MLGDDFIFAVLDRGPVQLAGVDAFDAEFFGFFQVVPEFGIEEQGFGRDAADVQAGAAEESVFFDERGLQAVLAGADGGRVAGGAAADDGDVVNCVGQSGAPLLGTDDDGQTFDSRTGWVAGPNWAGAAGRTIRTPRAVGANTGEHGVPFDKLRAGFRLRNSLAYREAASSLRMTIAWG